MTSGGIKYLLECSKCGAKMTSTGTAVGGNQSCSHAYGPIQAPQEKTRKKVRGPIVYPTDAERNWLRIIDQNKQENTAHTAKFKQDIIELNKLKSLAMEEITSMIKVLRSKLDDRADELERELSIAFNERRGKINDNIKSLEQHKSKNEETKDNSEDLLADGDKPETEREKIIVGGCENIINSTPQLQYIETELRYTFDQLENIERKIAKFGILITREINSGKQCIFKSTSDATNAPSAHPKEVELPIIQLKNSTFDENKQKVKLSFKVNQKNENKEIDINDHLQIIVECAQDIDDEKGEDLKPIHNETVQFKHCKSNGKKYELYVNKKFNPGITVAFKLKPKFVSPDAHKYKSSEGKWSREQTYEIPEEDSNVTFNILFNNKQKTLSLEDEHMALTNFTQFKKQFMNEFKLEVKQNEILELSTNEGMLNNKSELVKYATDSYVIRGNIKRVKVEQEQAVPPPAFATAKVEQRNVAVAPAVTVQSNGSKGKKGPKQISTIVVFGDTKKRVVLKNNAKKNIYEYTMDTLRAKLSKKFGAKGLKGHFDLRRADGQIIEMDQHIVQYLAQYTGEIQVTQT